MGKKKKIRRLVEAVGHLLASPPDRKKLRKASAFEDFLQDLRERRTGLAAERDAAEIGSADELARYEDLELIDAQIAKAERLLAALRDESD